MAVSESQKRAGKKWDQNNKKKVRHSLAKSTTKGFILNKASLEELMQIEEWVETRKENLKK